MEGAKSLNMITLASSSSWTRRICSIVNRFMLDFKVYKRTSAPTRYR